ncbi:MAG: DEAD/DEAH box helicase [Burkholderiales bacterium]|nr:DEAD/DEAH box helicase [Burkholderiales bacterium]
MARPPKKPPQPPRFVNLRGEAIDLSTLRPGRPTPADEGADVKPRPWPPDKSFIPGAPAPKASAPAPALDAADCDTLWDAMCLAGVPRGKAWLVRFLRALALCTTQGHAFTPADIEAGIRTLQGQHRLVEVQGLGLDVPAAQREAELPRLLAGPLAGLAWQAWARASASYATAGIDPPAPELHSRAEAVAFARLLLFGGLGAEAFRLALRRTMGPAGNEAILGEALGSPFMPALFERMNAGVRAHLLEALEPALGSGATTHPALLAWLEARVDAAPAELSPVLRFALAERRLHRGDAAATERALAGLAGLGPALLRAALQAHAGRWPEAAEAFATALKEAAKTLRTKRGIAPYSLMQWYALSLLAQSGVAAWTQAMKFCIAESGARKPPADAGWGLWAHAAAVRLGDETHQPEAFAHRAGWNPRDELADNADRLILSAWLGLPPKGWTDAKVQATVRALQVTGLPWKADLVRQACERLGRVVPERLADDGPAWPVRFFAAPQEAWRDALAAIEALGGQRAAAPAGTEPTTLQWRITLDDEGRPLEVQPYERSAGVRGPGKPKPVPLSRVKKSVRLDARDAAVARCIDACRWAPSQLAIDVSSAVLALAGHPGVVLADEPDQPLELREALPTLEVQRVHGAEGNDQYVFRLHEALLARRPVDPGERFTSSDPSAEAERRNGLRILRDGPGRARLIRISPAQRRVAELVAKQWAVPAQARAELDAALRVLAGHFQLHSDADAGQAVPAEARLRAQLSPSGNTLVLRLLVQPFGSFGPLLVPGQGRARLLAVHQGLNLSTERDLAAEAAHQRAVFEALPFLADGGAADASWRLDNPEQALAVVERLPQLPGVAGLDWPRGKPLRVLPVEAVALQVGVRSGADWFAVEGELRVDEQRVLGLQQLMRLLQDSGPGRFVALGDGDYLALGEQLRRRLADLQALGQPAPQGLRVPAVAAGWLAETLEGTALTGDKAWAQRLQRLEEAAALQPEPPATLQAQLRGYQAEGFAWMARLAHAGLGACLADDMGLGKTVQTLALLLARAGAGPALVIAPTSVCSNWVAEAQRFAPSLRVQLYGEADRTRQLQTLAAGDVLVASYALVQIDAEAFEPLHWGTLVLDEAQALKNAATKRAKSVAMLRAAFRLALTGTPVENRLADLWSIMNLLNPGLLGSASQFGERFASAIERGHDEAARQRLRRLVSPFLLRRTKAQVLTDLPPRTEIVHRVAPGPEERSFLEAARRSAVERVAAVAEEAGAGQAAFHVLAELTRLRRAACDPRLVAPELGIIGAKAQEFEQLALELVANRHKALVFSQFTDFLGLLAERLVAAGISYQYLDGSTPAAERGKRVAAFQAGEGDLFLISLKAGGFGLNLTAADYVLIVDPWWNPAAEDQALGRAHRIGQQRPVTVYRLVTAGSIEERIVALHQDKRSLADGILEGQDSSAVLRPDELRELLREPPSPAG